jgi:diguanylate cyclase (GGDEF)-like protein
VGGIALTLVVVQSAFAGLHEVARSDSALVLISRSQRLHQDADMMHDALRADVFDAALGGAADTSDRTHTAVEAHSRELRRDLDGIRGLRLQGELHRALESLRPTLIAYADEAERLTDQAFVDRPTVLTKLPAFERTFDDLVGPQEAVTTELAKAHDRTRVKVGQSERAAQQRVVIASVGALLGLIGLAWMLSRMGRNLAVVMADLEHRSERERFSRELANAFDMIDNEADAFRLVERSLDAVANGTPAELLLAQSTRSGLEQIATSPSGGAARCQVEAAWDCMAVRRGSPLVFASSDALDACPRLANRLPEPCSAMCVPVSFMGRAVGVVHALGPAGLPPADDAAAGLVELASQVGARVNALRTMALTQVQATTDPLTGVLNRRAFEGRVDHLIESGQRFALAMADLDNFKSLNDSFGHDAGDRALCHFAKTLMGSLRGHDSCARYGGDEFAVVLPNMVADDAVVILDRHRQEMAANRGDCGVERFTVSFGVTDSSGGATFREMIRTADGGLLRAKTLGRDRVVVADGTEWEADPKVIVLTNRVPDREGSSRNSPRSD